MRRRRPPQDDLHNKERWLISYADFITLLFAFFVVMYSVSSVNEGKYKVLSETFTGVFEVFVFEAHGYSLLAITHLCAPDFYAPDFCAQDGRPILST